MTGLDEYRACGWQRPDGSLHLGCPPFAEPDGWRAVFVAVPMQRAVSFTILGEPASKANQRRAVTIGGVSRSIKSKKAVSFESVCLLQIPPAAKVMWACDVEVRMRIFYASRRPDLDESVVLDCLQSKFTGTGDKRKLVRRGVYVNDRQVKRKVIDWGLDPANPRVELTIFPMGQQELTT